jgi:Flp pilus assembly protein TadG
MKKLNHYQENNKLFGMRAQAIVEFAIVLPILLMMLVGIFEFARMVFIYASVTNASRNAVRYASAVGLEDTGTYHKYLYCDGIKQTAANSTFLLRPSDFTVTVSYDSGPTTSSLGTCNVSGGEAAISIPDEGRVNVTVAATYRPMVRLIPIPTKTFTVSSYRTILGIIDVDN